MTLNEARNRHAKLVEEIRQHDHAYYVLAQPSISDQAYDRLYHELLDLEKAFPELVTPESPSQRVGGAPLTEFKPVRHLAAMRSLDNTYSQEEVREFVARLNRLLPGESLEWMVEPKVDGVAIIGYPDTADNRVSETHDEALKWLKSARFKTPEKTLQCHDVEALLKAIEDLDKIRRDLTYETDGAVIKLNSAAQRERAGFTS